MPKDLIRYDLLVQEALKGVVRKVLANAARDGLPDEHHFYVSFRTEFPGVRISQRLREKHPQDMTIVLQHQFWDLAVADRHFEVGLSFSGVPERLLVPFDAVIGFFDPSVQFGLKFETDESGEEAGPRAATPGAGSEPALAPKTALPAIKKVPASKPAAVEKAEKAPKADKADKSDKADKPEKADKSEKAKPAPAGAAAQPEPGGAEVVSLDAFRKKP